MDAESEVMKRGSPSIRRQHSGHVMHRLSRKDRRRLRENPHRHGQPPLHRQHRKTAAGRRDADDRIRAEQRIHALPHAGPQFRELLLSQRREEANLAHLRQPRPHPRLVRPHVPAA